MVLYVCMNAYAIAISFDCYISVIMKTNNSCVCKFRQSRKPNIMYLYVCMYVCIPGLCAYMYCMYVCAGSYFLVCIDSCNVYVCMYVLYVC